jgi:PAS domain S-box-containing protein
MKDVLFAVLANAVEDFAIFTLDPHGIITTWNPGAVRIKGYSVDEALGQHWSMLYTAESRRRSEPEKHLEVAARGGRFRGIGPRRRKSGEVFPADVLIVPIVVDGAITAYCKFVQDLTESQRVLQERDLSWTNVQRLEGEALFRERFVSTLAHDLRSPLQAAAMGADLLLRHPGLGGDQHRWAAHVASAVARIDKMVTDLLDVQRVDAGGALSLRFAPCDLQVIARQTCAELAQRHGARFPLVCVEEIVGVWNEDGLRRVVENLLSNAVKYGAADAPIVTTVQRIDGRVILAVHNEGVPIPLDEQRQLFEPFHRTQASEREGKQGWGLGLALVQAIVIAHHGLVKVESYPGSGTTFVIDLPLDASATRVTTVSGERAS